MRRFVHGGICVALLATSARANLVELAALQTELHPTPSSLTLTMDLFGIPLFSMTDLRIQGQVPAVFEFDATNSGTIEVDTSLNGPYQQPIPGQVFVAVTSSSEIADVGTYLSQFNWQSLVPASVVSNADLVFHIRDGSQHQYLVRLYVDDSTDVVALANSLESLAFLDFAEPNFMTIYPPPDFMPGSLDLESATRSFAGVLLTGTANTQGIGMQLQLGPESVSNRSLLVDNETPGALTLDSGKISVTFTGGAFRDTLTALLQTNVIQIDLSDHPLTFEFQRLGTSILSATADNDGTGVMNYGELSLPFTLVSSLEFQGLPISVTLSGSLHAGAPPPVIFPEIGSLGLISLATAISCAMYVARRQRLHG